MYCSLLLLLSLPMVQGRVGADPFLAELMEERDLQLFNSMSMSFGPAPTSVPTPAPVSPTRSPSTPAPTSDPSTIPPTVSPTSSPVAPPTLVPTTLSPTPAVTTAAPTPVSTSAPFVATTAPAGPTCTFRRQFLGPIREDDPFTCPPGLFLCRGNMDGTTFVPGAFIHTSRTVFGCMGDAPSTLQISSVTNTTTGLAELDVFVYGGDALLGSVYLESASGGHRYFVPDGRQASCHGARRRMRNLETVGQEPLVALYACLHRPCEATIAAQECPATTVSQLAVAADEADVPWSWWLVGGMAAVATVVGTAYVVQRRQHPRVLKL